MFKALIALAMAACSAGGFGLGYIVRGKKDTKEHEAEINMIIDAKAKMDMPIDMTTVVLKAEEIAQVPIDAPKIHRDPPNLNDMAMKEAIKKMNNYGMNELQGDFDGDYKEPNKPNEDRAVKIPGWFDEIPADEEHPEDDLELEDEDDDDLTLAGYDDPQDDPYPITWSAYNNTRQYYAKVHVTYFNEDNMFIIDGSDTLNGHELEDPDKHFCDTDDLVRTLRETREDIYIRNDPEQTDYIVSYSEGFFMNSPELE